MATYLEFANYVGTENYQILLSKVRVAIAIKAKSIADLPTPTPAQVGFAKLALQSPGEVSGQIINYVIAANSDASIAQINAASDGAIQTNVNAAVDDLLSL
jgi:hypothetical protein